MRQVRNGVVGEKIIQVPNGSFHSLQATWVRNCLFRCLRDSSDVDTNDVAQNIVYEHPTIASLASIVFQIGTRSPKGMLVMTPDERARAMSDMSTKYSQDLPSSEHTSRPTSVPEDDVFLVTGTTGALGAAVLAQLLSSRKVGRVYAINRQSTGSSSLLERQQNAFAKQGLSHGSSRSPKLQLVETNMDEANLGLTSALLDEVDTFPILL